MAAVQRNGRVAERMMILNEGTGALIARLGQVSAILSSQEGRKDLPWTDSKMKKVVACLQKKFPEYPSLSEVEKTQGPGELQVKAKEICEQLEDMYVALIDGLEFIEEAQKLLAEVSDDYACPPFEDIVETCSGYLDLFVAYIQVVLEVTIVTDKDMLACFYAYCYQYATGSAEVSFTKVANLLERTCKDRATALGAIRAFFKQEPSGTALRREPLIVHITRIIMGSETAGGSGVLNAYMCASSMDIVREKDILGVLSRHDDVEFPTGVGGCAEEGLYRIIPLLQRMSSWISHAVLACPDIIYRHDDGVALLTAVSSMGWNDVSRREPLNMHSELYQIFHDKYWIAAFEDKRSKKGFADAKAAMKKSVEECISGSFQLHSERRERLELAIRSIHHYVADCPGLLGPHWHLVLVALSLAKRELLWYIWHMQPFPKNEKAYKVVGRMWAPTPGSQESFATLFSAMDSLRDIAVRYEKVASEYHTAYLRDVHANLLRDAISGCRQVLQSVLKEPRALALVDSIVERAKSAVPEQMEGLCLDEKRFVLAVLRSILPHNSLDTPLRVLLHRLQKISLSAAYICRPGEALTEAQGLNEASLCPLELSSILEALIESRPALAAKCVPIFDSFTLSVRQCSIGQIAAVGREATRQAKKVLERCARAGCQLVRQIQGCQSGMDTIPGPVIAGSDKVEAAGPGGSYWRIIEAGMGAFGPHGRAHERLLELCAFFSTGRPSIRVYDDDLHGSAILLVALRSDFEQTVKDALWGRGQPRIELQCPSSVMAAIERYVNALHVVEEFGGIRIVEVTDFVLKKLMIDPSGGQLGSRINATIKDEIGGCETTAIAKWYARHLVKPGVYYSPMQRAFFSKNTNLEHFTTFKELRSLCSLVGPAGVRSLEMTLIAESVARVRNLHTFLQINARSFKAFEQHESASAGLAQIDTLFGKLSELSQLEEAAQAAIALGSITMFRHHLRLALSSAVSHSLYPTTLAAAVLCAASPTPGSDKLGPLEAFAHDFGFSAPGWPVDFALREALTADLGPLSAGVLGKGEWHCAAFGLASLFCAAAMQGDYSSQQDALRNNAHCVPHPLISIMSIVGERNNAKGKGLPEMLDVMVSVASRAVVGSMRKADGSVGGKLFDDRGTRRGLIILLECLVREAEVFAPNVRRHSVPFTLTRSERLEPLSTSAEKAKFALGDDEDEGDAQA